MTAPDLDNYERKEAVPSASDYLPNWEAPRFIVVEKQFHWTGAVNAEVQSRLKTDITAPSFQHCSTAREALLAAELRNTAALVLCLPGMEKEILGLLGRLNRSPARQHPMLAIGETRHVGILPILMQSGVQTMLTEIKDDIAVSEWCLRVLGQQIT